MEFKVGAVLRKITINQGAKSEDGGREDPLYVIQLEAPVTRALADLGFFVGQEVALQIETYQAVLGEDVGEPLLRQVER